MARALIQGYVEQGGNTVTTDGRLSTTKVQKSFPLATVTVFNAGTAVNATIFSDSGGTPKANPFTANSDGSWGFWANPAQYDVQFSGAGIATPYTIFNLFAADFAATAPLLDPGSNGILARTALQVVTPRTITGTANEITVTNGSGAAGNPTLSIPASVTFTGKTITGGTFSVPTITGGTHTAITSLGIRSTGSGAFDLTLANTENLTTGRTLTLTLNDANRTVNLGGNLTTANAFITSGNNSLTLTTTGATNVTLPTTGTLATLAGTETFTNKTLTSPRIGTALLDTNGNEVIETPAVGSAVNQLRVANSVTTSPVTVSAQGDDANIGLTVATKGTGNYILQTNSVNRFTIHGTNAESYFGKGITDASPTNYSLNGTGGSGSNIVGAHLDLAGGKGTGNAVPGQIAVRYPLIGASGTTLQSLSTDRYPVITSLYSNTTAGTAIANTTTETSLFTGVTASAGSTSTLEAGISRAGTRYMVRINGNMANTGTPTIQIKGKMGATTIVDSTAATTASGVNGKFWLELEIAIFTIGATASVVSWLKFMYSSANTGTVTMNFINAASGGTSVDLTASQLLDVTIQWGTASASNTIQTFEIGITRER